MAITVQWANRHKLWRRRRRKLQLLSTGDKRALLRVVQSVDNQQLLLTVQEMVDLAGVSARSMSRILDAAESQGLVHRAVYQGCAYWTLPQAEAVERSPQRIPLRKRHAATAVGLTLQRYAPPVDYQQIRADRMAGMGWRELQRKYNLAGKPVRAICADLPNSPYNVDINQVVQRILEMLSDPQFQGVKGGALTNRVAIEFGLPADGAYISRLLRAHGYEMTNRRLGLLFGLAYNLRTAEEQYMFLESLSRVNMMTHFMRRRPWLGHPVKIRTYKMLLKRYLQQKEAYYERDRRRLLSGVGAEAH